MDNPRVYYDFEFLFLNGQRECYTAEEGRDRIAADDARVRLELHHTEDAIEEIIVHRSALALMRTVKRIIHPDTRTEGLKLVDPLPA